MACSSSPSASCIRATKLPSAGLLVQAAWAVVLCVSGSYGQLLDYIIFAVLVFYILTIVGLFVLRFKRPEAPRPYKAWGYPRAARALYRDGGMDLYRIIAIQAPIHVAGTGAGFAWHSGLFLLVAAVKSQASQDCELQSVNQSSAEGVPHSCPDCFALNPCRCSRKRR